MLHRHVLATLALLATLPVLVTLSSGARADLAPPVYVGQWGTPGSGPGQFLGPMGIAVDGLGNVYVGDTGNNRYSKFTGQGVYVASSGHGDHFCPIYIALSQQGDVFTCGMCWYDLIYRFDAAGNFVKSWGTYGTAPGQFHNPQGIVVDPDGNILLCDPHNNRITKFDQNGTYLSSWGGPGSAPGRFNLPRGIAVDLAGNIYVTEDGNSRIQKFSKTGAFLLMWGSSGTGNGQFNDPTGICVDASGLVYVADKYNYRIQVFDENGNYPTKWGSKGSGNGQFNSPNGIAVDAFGNVYATDDSNCRIQKFAFLPTPARSSTWGRLKTVYR